MSNHRVVISSTIRDLPEHRKEVRDACLRQKMLPLMMEHLPASPADAIHESLQLVDEATIYLGVFGHRYGHIPVGHSLSITEMEYERAVDRGIPRLVFLMHEDHLVRAADVEQGEAALRLQAFKERLLRDQVAVFFQSPVDLRAHVINSLSHFRQPDLQEFHFVSDIPSPPEPYIAHPYTLLDTHALVGRQAELDLLTDWVACKDAEIHGASILVLVAIGGMGKSAVTWKWFQEIAPQEMSPLAGRLWWSFYESDATFENFVIRALAYVKGISRAEAQALPLGEREEQLLNLLQQRPFLLVLDGLERILVAYARADASGGRGEDPDEEAGTEVAGAPGILDSSEAAFKGRHRLRRTADPRAGHFLRRLGAVRRSRILVSTRLFPAELQTVTGAEIPGTRGISLSGLTDIDALTLWRSFGVSGSRDALQPLFRSFGNYPLLIRALAGEVARYRRAPGNFQEWLENHPDFDPFRLSLVQRKSHVLSFALRGLGSETRKVLVTLSAFRMPAAYDTLVSLLVGPGRLLPSEAELDAELADLEDRGLVGWDRRANRYDLHPIVRGVAWQSLGQVGRRIIYENLQAHFESLPTLTRDEAQSLDDLAPAIELFHTLVGLKSYDAAYSLFSRHITARSLAELGLSREGAEWLEMLFPQGSSQGAPALTGAEQQKNALWDLAICYHESGQILPAVHLWERIVDGYEAGASEKQAALDSISVCLLPLGRIYDAEVAIRQSLLDHLPVRRRSIAQLGHILSLRGRLDEAEMLLEESLSISTNDSRQDQDRIYIRLHLAMHYLRTGRAEKALAAAESASGQATVRQMRRVLAAATNTLGEIHLANHELAKAASHFTAALKRARSISYVQEEITSLIGLARTLGAQGEPDRPRELLNDVWEPIERGSFQMHRAAALIAQTELALRIGDRSAATAAAREAYKSAWCDGPPYTDHWNLQASGSLLEQLGEAPPLLEAQAGAPRPELKLNMRRLFIRLRQSAVQAEKKPASGTRNPLQRRKRHGKR